jgi:archaetidylinositol phosphate synthase
MTQNQDHSSGQGQQQQQHTRIIDTLLGKAEKRTLLWLAARMPRWVGPDTLTMLGLLASVIIFLGYALTYYDKAFLWLASLGFILNWFGDSLDGTLARYRKIERPRYGFFVDHVIDAVSAVLIFLGIGLSPYVRFDLALLALVAYLLLSIYVYLITYVNGIFRISYAHLGPTEMRLVAVLANTVVFFVGNVIIRTPVAMMTFYDMIAIVVMVLALSIFTVNSYQSAMSLSKEDRAAMRARALQERAARAARRQTLRDERAMRRAAAKAARTARRLEIPTTGRDGS